MSSDLFVDLLSAKALLLHWIGMCLGKPALGRAALCSKDELRVAEVLVAHLKNMEAGGPGVFQPSGERYRLRRRAEAMTVVRVLVICHQKHRRRTLSFHRRTEEPAGSMR